MKNTLLLMERNNVITSVLNYFIRSPWLHFCLLPKEKGVFHQRFQDKEDKIFKFLWKNIFSIKDLLTIFHEEFFVHNIVHIGALQLKDYGAVISKFLRYHQESFQYWGFFPRIKYFLGFSWLLWGICLGTL